MTQQSTINRQIGSTAPGFAILLAIVRHKPTSIPDLDYPNRRRSLVPLIPACADSRDLLPVIDYPTEQRRRPSRKRKPQRAPLKIKGRR
jgi:hypothetical protein